MAAATMLPMRQEQSSTRTCFSQRRSATLLQWTMRVTFLSSRPEPGSLPERGARAAMARLLRAGSRKDCGDACRSFVRLACSDLADLLDAGSKRDQFELALKRRSVKRVQRGPTPSKSFLPSILLTMSCLMGGWRLRSVMQ
jgi:hypothetical protein